MYEKTIIAASITLTAIGSVNVHADIAITNMSFTSTTGTENYASGGSLTDAGDGTMFSVDPFFYHTWTATQQTQFMDNTGSFAGSSESGSYDYASDIAAMTNGQIAVGFYFNWNEVNEIAVLEIFDCAANICTGTSATLQNGPIGAIGDFSGTGSATVSAVPVPAAAWLMGSGLLGLAGPTRRNKHL